MTFIYNAQWFLYQIFLSGAKFVKPQAKSSVKVKTTTQDNQTASDIAYDEDIPSEKLTPEISNKNKGACTVFVRFNFYKKIYSL